MGFATGQGPLLVISQKSVSGARTFPPVCGTWHGDALGIISCVPLRSKHRGGKLRGF